MRYVRYIPGFAILLALYDITALIPATRSGAQSNISVVSIPLPYKDVVLLSVGETFALLCLIVLFFEILKATRTSRDTLADHLLSVAVFVVCLIQFLVWPASGTPAFFMLLMFSLADVVMGFTVTFATSRRDINIGDRG